ncbi:MAG: neutral zinc metallopeptidase [Isosphaeraceae bacterium]
MRWRGRRESENVEDRRHMAGPVAVGGIGTILIVLLGLFFGVDVRPVLQQVQQGQGQPGPGAPGKAVDPAEEEAASMVKVILADTEDVWNELFQALGQPYQEPKLVLFSGRVDSACGQASAAVGPFYCPADRQVYIDLSFFNELERRFKAPGEFAQAYVVAHEVGHHVQNLLGYSEKVSRMQSRVGKAEANELSVRLELQADFLAGVWAHHAQKMKNLLERGDVPAALNAASQIGDDKIQMRAQGYVVPDAFTHGSSEQRVRWFRKGFQSGKIEDGDTFSTDDL